MWRLCRLTKCGGCRLMELCEGMWLWNLRLREGMEELRVGVVGY